MGITNPPRSKYDETGNVYGNTKDPKQPKQSWERRTELEASTFLIQTILQSYSHQYVTYRQYGTGTKTEIQTNGTR